MSDNIKPKKFVCSSCDSEYYVDMAVCRSCIRSNTVFPIPCDVYHLHLNGKLYGAGSPEYMIELIEEYVVHRKMYGKESVELKVVKVGGE